MPFIRLTLAAALVAASLAGPANAGDGVDAVRACASASTTPADLEELLVYSWVATSKHPRLQPLVNITSVQRDAIYARAGAIVSRIFFEDCKEQTIQAMVTEGGPARRLWLDLSEPMSRASASNPTLARETGIFRNYIDNAKLNALVEQAKKRMAQTKSGSATLVP
jgi:hypothetical protein